MSHDRRFRRVQGIYFWRASDEHSVTRAKDQGFVVPGSSAGGGWKGEILLRWALNSVMCRPYQANETSIAQ